MSDPFFSSDGSITLRHMPTDSRPMAQFEARLPTPKELERVAARSYGIQLLSLGSGADISWLRSLPELQCLEIFASDVDLSVIEGMGQLRELTLVGVGNAGVDLSKLPMLSSFYGELPQATTALANPNLRDALLQELGRAPMPPILGTLRRLEVSSAPAVRRIEVKPGVADLESLSLYGLKEFDAECLTQFPKLRSLSLGRIGSLRGVAALAELPLVELGINGVRKFDNVDALSRLAAEVDVSILGSSKKILKDVARSSGASWRFY